MGTEVAKGERSKMKLLLRFVFLFAVLLPLSTKAKDRTFKELEKAMEEASPAWTGKKNYKELQRKFVDTWSEVEIATAGRELAFVFNDDESDPVVERWGRIDPATALKFYLDHWRDEISTRSDEPVLSNPTHREMGEMVVGMCIERVLMGWAEMDPRAAWAYLINPEGRILKETGVEVFHQSLSQRFVAKIAMTDAALPWNGFLAIGNLKQFDPRTQAIFRTMILEGMAEGLPNDTPWEKLFARLPDEFQKNKSLSRNVVRGPLLGRWLEADRKAAMAWFKSPAGEIASKKIKTIYPERMNDFEIIEIPPKELVVDADLSQAAACWLRRNPENATEWIKEHPELVHGILQDFGGAEPSDRRLLRGVFRACLDLDQRETLLKKVLDRYLSRQVYDESLIALIGCESSDEQRSEISELKVSEELAAEVLKGMAGER